MQPLEYQTPTPTKLTLQELDGVVRLIFPPSPKWARTLSVIGAFAWPAGEIFKLGVVFYLIWQFRKSTGLSIPIDISAVVITSLLIIFLGVMATCVFIHDRRCGHLSCILEMSEDKFTYTRKGFWGMKVRSCDLTDIIAFEMNPVSDIFRRKYIFRLIFRFRSGRKFLKVISTKEKELPPKISAAFDAAIQKSRQAVSPMAELRKRESQFWDTPAI